MLNALRIFVGRWDERLTADINAATAEGAEERLAKLREMQETIQGCKDEIRAAERAMEIRGRYPDALTAIGDGIVQAMSDADGGLVWVHGEDCERPINSPGCPCRPRGVHVLPCGKWLPPLHPAGATD